ncbi:acyl-CoA/acyl-ACP dehydrogenase [Frankia sp. AgB1.9]|uniref:acyl-CoA dehydrogenase family protein n=2 Tax=Frankia TaxID=1854 RepID=UPI001931690D|nr:MULTISPECIES: acyl-CoA dehydrogenase family protein [unclassified Frankia]MBL7548769.1 acyl-CoA/acyl-ACP dehydrogenase [Frankia sp. AgB1.9]MBL7623899.1 acyl-CoA/acyl-ACP dehydrogenase [Frankia sp. AgB1.8]
MTTTTANDELLQLREALRGTLGTEGQDLQPTVAADWRPVWPALAELGLTALCVPEPLGGFGLRTDAAVMAAMELGAALYGGPYAGLTASAHALAQAAGDAAADELLAGILAGERVCAFGRLGADGRLARLVDGVPGADALLLLDQPGGGLVLFADPDDWTADPAPHGFDVSRTCGDVTVSPGAGRRLAPAGQAVELYELLLAADAVGCVRRMLDRAVAYAGQRQAFGRPIGGFQAVQHRLADHAVRAQGMTLVVRAAADLFDADPVPLRRAVATAALSVSSAAPLILHDLLQLTGAIGFTWEYGLHLYERRVHQDARLAANPRAAQRSLAELEGWTTHAH